MKDVYMKKGDGFVLVYSVDNESSMEELEALREEVLRIKVNFIFYYFYTRKTTFNIFFCYNFSACHISKFNLICFNEVYSKINN